MARRMAGAPLISTGTGHTGGMFDFWHMFRPEPFNPAFDPKAADRFKAVTASMEADDYYTGHTREECAAEWRRRYDARKAEGS